MYSRAITQSHRSAIIFCIDCSTSMQEHITFNNTLFSKAEIAALFTNIMIDELYLRSSRYRHIRNYYDIAVIGYGDGGAFSMLGGEDISFVPIPELMKVLPEEEVYYFKHNIENEDHKISFTVHPWIKPRAGGRTPMYEALVETYRLVDKWCSQRINKGSFPPMVFNLTDGESTDATHSELVSIAHNIKSTGTRDGNTLMINVHIGNIENSEAILFPRVLDCQSTPISAHTLYHMSSEAPRNMEPLLPPEQSNSYTFPRRLMAHNTSPYDLLNIIHIGSESLQKR